MRYIQVIIAAAIWGGSYPFTKYLVTEVSPETVVTLRAVIGALLLTLVTGSKLRLSDFRFGHIWKIFIMSVLGVSAQQYVQAYALTYTSAGHAGWLIVTIPIIIAAAMAGLGERIGLPRIIAFMLGAVGALLVVFSNAAGTAAAPAPAIKADLIFLTSCLAWTGYVILTKKWLTFWPQTKVTAVTMIVAMFTMLVVWSLSGKAGELAAISAKGWVCAGYLGVLSSALAYTFWNNSVETLGPVTSSYFIYIQPFFTVLSAYLFIGEPPAAGAFAGGLLIMAGVYFVNLNKNSVTGGGFIGRFLTRLCGNV
ncbi:MAG: DMT family transporter [Elusimicrobia bacterium]|nr:DMT family transporter [Elusimicrobiota bacterium]